MKKFLATAVFCLALVPVGTFAALYTVFPDGNVMMHLSSLKPAPGPFTSCNPSLPWYQVYGLDVNNLSTLFPLHIRVVDACLDTTGGILMGYHTDLYGPAAPTITDTGTAYTVAWTVQQNAAGTWSPAGTFTFTVLKTSL